MLAWQGASEAPPQIPAILRPSLEPLQVLQKARQKLQKVAKEGMAAAIVQQDHSGVLRFSALFPPLGYQVCGPCWAASDAWALNSSFNMGGFANDDLEPRMFSAGAPSLWCHAALMMCHAAWAGYPLLCPIH